MIKQFFLFSILFGTNALVYAKASTAEIPLNGFSRPLIDEASHVSVDDWREALESSRDILKPKLAALDHGITLLKKFSDDQKALNLRWVDQKEGNSPAVLVIDLNGKKQKICNAFFQKGTHPGTLTQGGCLITYGGDTVIMPVYKVLSGKTNVLWGRVSSEDLLQYQLIQQDPDSLVWKKKLIPIQGGFSDTPNYAKNTPLYICKAVYNQETYIGKVVATGCNIAVGSHEIEVADFEVLLGSKNN